MIAAAANGSAWAGVPAPWLGSEIECDSLRRKLQRAVFFAGGKTGKPVTVERCKLG